MPKISQYPNGGTLQVNDKLVIARSGQNYSIDGASVQPLNYLIAPTVTSNNLTVTITHLDGSTPSASNPLYFKINNNYRALTSALSLTLNAGTQWFALGSAFASLSQNFFVYVGWRSASSAVVLGISRIPFAKQYNDFSATTTNELHGAFSTAPGTNDDVEVIGRFSATLGASASFNWSVPTFTSKNLLCHPFYETNWMQWSPQFTNLTVGNGTLSGYYRIKYKSLEYKWSLIWGNTTSISGSVTHSLPLTRVIFTDVRPNGLLRLYDQSTGASYAGLTYYLNSTTALLLAQNASATYLTAAALSSTVPMTWTTTDEIQTEACSYPISS